MTNAGKLKEEIIRLGPWHHEVAVTPEVSTRAYLDAPEGYYPDSGPKDPRRVTLIDDREGWLRMLEMIYPEGLRGRSFLDCACNCGAYGFFAKEGGAGRCFGFDVREHWIDQARFLQHNRTAGPTDEVGFEVMDLYDLPKAGLEPFDITLYKGIFYHLPDPITGLKAAADLTKELLILDTAVRTDLPDGMLAIAQEGKEQVMTGVYGLNWFPTGPKVLEKILGWLGFPEVKLVTSKRGKNPRRPELGRMRVVASRMASALDAFAPLDVEGECHLIPFPKSLKGRELPERRR
jgi:tRNA (mo5U34)-methyltransferase